jgi:hypothetical protein
MTTKNTAFYLVQSILWASLFLFFSGCVNISEKIALNEDLSGTITIELRQDMQMIQEQFTAIGFEFDSSAESGKKNQPISLKDYVAKSNDVLTMYFLERLAFAKAYEIGDLRQSLRKAVREKTNGDIELVALNKKETPLEIKKKEEVKDDDNKTTKSVDSKSKDKEAYGTASYTFIKLKFKDVNKLKTFSEELFSITVTKENGMLEYKHDILKILTYYYNRMKQSSAAKPQASAWIYNEVQYNINSARLLNLAFKFELELPYPIIESNAPWEDEGKIATFVFPIADMLEGKVRVFSLWAKAKKP